MGADVRKVNRPRSSFDTPSSVQGSVIKRRRFEPSRREREAVGSLP